MCTVVGYIGKSLCRTYIFEGLARLEYRGYDSAGFACLEPDSQKLLYSKASGQLSQLVERLQQNPIDGFLGIGHTRWSTHGNFSERNAHPHFDCSKIISVVHNGIIENHDELKKQLLKEGHVFESDTDTEVVSHLFESFLAEKEFNFQTISEIVQMLDGMYACIIMMQMFPDTLVAIRKKSPLCVGIGDGEMFIASDVIAFAGKTDKVFFLPDESFAFVDKHGIKAYSFAGQEIPVIVEKTNVSFDAIDKGGHEHFMLKEIYEQKNAIAKTVASLRSLGKSLWDQLGVTAEKIVQFKEISLLACGTSWHAARIAQFFFESICNIPVSVHLASEFRQMSFFPQDNTLYVVISQSGETADVLEALRLINEYDLSTVALTNVATSTVVREAQGFVQTQAGPEIAVASTKAFSTQLAALYWLAHRIAVEKKLIEISDLVQAEEDLLRAAEQMEKNLEQYKNIIDSQYAPQYAAYDKAMFLGRHISYPLAMESALKIKEVAYVFAVSYPAGELKHGSLALVDETVPVYVLSHPDPMVYQKIVSNAHEVKARGGHIIAFAYEGQHELCELAETTFIISGTFPPLLGTIVMLGVMQYFVYAVARQRGCTIDKPRNLAKSVTVE
ncbi:MAG TPA: glutamine--fructose-6-phosphate transaminase (isomerizing) [Candidatus Babeliales bacterium]|jgi:glucosamine--fructose-6-phosphate aminotransferase (isomerizing)|nr:glutamine--fructose-6-phosphate transaminase (isomerizing) [Candidatus Babeliales bacterium]